MEMKALSLLLALCLAPIAAFGQGTTLSPPGIVWEGQIRTPEPTQAIGYDSGTGNPCIVGSTATCAVRVTGGGGTVTPIPATGTGGQNAITVTNSSASLLAARTAPKYALSVKNESTTASIAICFGTCTAALNTAGSITLAPGQVWSASSAFIPLDAIVGISSAATSPATIQAN